MEAFQPRMLELSHLRLWGLPDSRPPAAECWDREKVPLLQSSVEEVPLLFGVRIPGVSIEEEVFASSAVGLQNFWGWFPRPEPSPWQAGRQSHARMKSVPNLDS